MKTKIEDVSTILSRFNGKREMGNLIKEVNKQFEYGK